MPVVFSSVFVSLLLVVSVFGSPLLVVAVSVRNASSSGVGHPYQPVQSVVALVFKMSEQLSVFRWNVRGLNAPAGQEAVRNMVHPVNPKLVCLQETKLSHITSQLVTEVLGPRFNEFGALPADGTRGGMLLGWNSDYIEATNLQIGRFSLSMIMGGLLLSSDSCLWAIRRL
jgi:hypothetical protein